MSTLHHDDILLDAQADYDTFAAKREWRNCEAVIDSLREQGFNHEADILRKDMLQTQYIVSENKEEDLVYVPFEHEEPPMITPEEDDAPIAKHEPDERTKRILEEGEQSFISRHEER